MNYLFWNTGKKQVNVHLQHLIKEYSCDVIALAEYSDDINALLFDINQDDNYFYVVPKIACERIEIITKFKPSKINHLNETSYYTIKKIPHESLGTHLIAFVHLPSKQHMTDFDYVEESRLLKEDIEEAEKNTERRTVVVGDFNMNPFENAMVNASSIHSISSKEISRQFSRTIKGRKYSMFYNPMWNLMGDIMKPPGTYFYNNSSHINYYWNIFDQVIIRPSLIDNFICESLKIINESNEFSLVNEKGYPNVSDHLPIYFQII